MYIADLHIHSRFSRATSKDCDVPHLDWWAQRKGIQLLGTGDFTHPAWRAELKEQLVPAGEGVYTLKEEFCLPDPVAGEHPRFIITGEISSIYKRDGKTRKVHNLILLPSLEAADELSAKLEAIGNIHSDGRPILGLDSRDLMELTLDTCPDAEFIPAHIWTPHFSMFGAFSGFNTIGACFDDMAPYIHAVETGLSSDPPMNWRVSALDGLTLVSHSDAHSPSKLGREANLLDTEISYPALIKAIRTGQGFLGTVEFFPEEGKYHLDGHRNCCVCFSPSETAEHGGLCPVCGKKLTVGVEHRVEELADRPAGFRPEHAKPFESLAPLPEVIAASTGKSATCKAAVEQYEYMLYSLGPEFSILREVSIEDIEQAAGPCIAEGIRRLRAGQVERKAGFDGEYGKISLLSPSEMELFNGQTSLFGVEALPKNSKKHKSVKRPMPAVEDLPKAVSPDILNPEQEKAVCAAVRVVAVIAGPGTGKTKTLVSRIAYLVEQQHVKPEEITAVTFTNQAASEMRQRLSAHFGGTNQANRMMIGTFHSICLHLLGEVHLISQGEALTIADDILRECGSRQTPKSLLQAVSRVKNGTPLQEADLDETLYQAYCTRLQNLHVLDFDDLLTEALKLDIRTHKEFSHLLVDEFQDINAVQYQLVQAWGQKSKSIFVIGDPDQSIYGFRGSDSQCFQRLEDTFPTREIRLVENYRSTPEILDASIPVIEKNPGTSRRLSPNRPSGTAVRLIKAPDDFSEGIFIAKEISRMTGGVDMLESQQMDSNHTVRAFSDIAVLCRTHRQLELIEKCLRHDDIPCVIRGREEFLDANDVRGGLGLFRFLLNPEDTIALETALRLLWSCPDDLLLTAQRLCQKGLDSPDLQKEIKGYGHLEAWLERVLEWQPLMKKEKPWKLVARWEEAYGSSQSLERLRNTAVFHSTIQNLCDTLILGQEADLQRAAGKRWESGAVHLMTLHGSKGLEFPAVFVAGIKKGILPMESQGNPSDLEEERRLFYVGMTRAREELILSTTTAPSMFLTDLPDQIIPETIARRERPVEQLSLF